MHELSIVMSIIDIANQQAQQANARIIEEIELDIGCLSTIEPEAFDFAWQQAVKGTSLEKATRTINRIEGRGQCMHCEAEFPVQQLYDPCPHCGRHLVNLTQGRELKVKSLVVS